MLVVNDSSDDDDDNFDDDDEMIRVIDIVMFQVWISYLLFV